MMRYPNWLEKGHKMVTVFLADGFEEIEAISPIDILRRAGISVRTCSIGSDRVVSGAHGILLKADFLLEELSDDEQMIVLPGGMPGTLHLKQSKPLADRILCHAANGGQLAAICAAPCVFGTLGLLRGKRACCYPGMEKELLQAVICQEDVVTDSGIVTSRGAGTAFSFALELVRLLKDEKSAAALAEAMCFERVKS